MGRLPTSIGCPKSGDAPFSSVAVIPYRWARLCFPLRPSLEENPSLRGAGAKDLAIGADGLAIGAEFLATGGAEYEGSARLPQFRAGAELKAFRFAKLCTIGRFSILGAGIGLPAYGWL